MSKQANVPVFSITFEPKYNFSRLKMVDPKARKSVELSEGLALNGWLGDSNTIGITPAVKGDEAAWQEELKALATMLSGLEIDFPVAKKQKLDPAVVQAVISDYSQAEHKYTIVYGFGRALALLIAEIYRRQFSGNTGENTVKHIVEVNANLYEFANDAKGLQERKITCINENTMRVQGVTPLSGGDTWKSAYEIMAAETAIEFDLVRAGFGRGTAQGQFAAKRLSAKFPDLGIKAKLCEETWKISPSSKKELMREGLTTWSIEEATYFFTTQGKDPKKREKTEKAAAEKAKTAGFDAKRVAALAENSKADIVKKVLGEVGKVGDKDTATMLGYNEAEIMLLNQVTHLIDTKQSKLIICLNPLKQTKESAERIRAIVDALEAGKSSTEIEAAIKAATKAAKK